MRSAKMASPTPQGNEQCLGLTVFDGSLRLVADDQHGRGTLVRRRGKLSNSLLHSHNSNVMITKLVPQSLH